MSYGQQPYGGQPYGQQYGQNPYAQPQAPYQQPNPYQGQPQQPQPGYGGYGQQPPTPHQPPMSQASPALQTPVPAPAPRKAPMSHHSIVCVTTDTVPGRETREAIGAAIGVVVRPKITGPEQPLMLTQARQQAVAAAAEMAAAEGADAVVGLRFETSLLDSAASAEIVAYGTAVSLLPAAPQPGGGSASTRPIPNQPVSTEG